MSGKKTNKNVETYDTSPVGMMRHANEVAAVQMRAEGATYDDIVAAGIYNTSSAAYKAVQRSLQRQAREPVETVRQMEVNRLDLLLKAVWFRAISIGHPDDIRSCLQIMKRRSALLGLDAPKKIDIADMVRQMAVLMGLDPELAVNETQALLDEAKEVGQ